MMEPFDSSLRYSSHLKFVPLIVEQFCIETMAEVGILHGALSETILNNCPQIKTYYLVDPWQPFEIPIDHSQEVWDSRYIAVKSKMEQYSDKAYVLRLTSLKAAGLFEPESLDFVYIDANHSFRHVDEDIKAWWPKIKTTGYLAGHDMIERWGGVVKAVEANFGKQYFCGQPTFNWDGVWIVSKKVYNDERRGA